MASELLGKRYPNHAAHSGYDRLADYLGVPLTWYGDTAESCFDTIATLTRDVIHFIYADVDYRPTLGVRPHGKIIGTFHVPPERISSFGVTSAHVQQLDAVIMVGSSQRALFEQYGAKRIFTILHGVDTDFFYPPVLNESRNPLRVLTVGKHLRDINLFLKVATLAYETAVPLTFHFVYRGRSPFSAGVLPPNCVYHGHLDDNELREQYRISACLFLPLLDTTANNALLEAISCGTPYVASDVGSIRDYVDDEGGILLAKASDACWLDALIAMSTAGDANIRRSQICRNLALRCDWRLIAKQVREIHSCVAGM